MENTFSSSRRQARPSPTAQIPQHTFVVVFGYPADKFSLTAEYFKSLGEATEPEKHLEITNCFRIGYADIGDAMRAVRKNGDVFAGSWMIGTKWAVSIVKKHCTQDIEILLNVSFRTLRKQKQWSDSQSFGIPCHLLLSHKRTTQAQVEMKCQSMSPIQLTLIPLPQLWAHLSNLLHRHQHSENTLVAVLQNHLRRKHKKVGQEVSYPLRRVYRRGYFPVGCPPHPSGHRPVRVLLAKWQISFLDGSVHFSFLCFPANIAFLSWVTFLQFNLVLQSCQVSNVKNPRFGWALLIIARFLRGYLQR